MNRSMPLTSLVVLSIILAACSSAAPQGTTSAQPEASQLSALDTVCAEGAKEGKVVYAGGFSPESFDKITQPFKAKYPGIQVEFNPGDDKVQRVTTESAAGRLTIDAVQMTTEVQALKERNLLADNIDWAALKVAPTLIYSGVALRLSRLVRGLAYNTNKVKPADLPATWEGLVDPKWSGQLSTGPRGLALSTLAPLWGRDKVAAYARDLLRVTKPKLIQGVTANLVPLASGETSLTTEARDAEVAEQRAKGAPVAIHYFDVIPVSDAYEAVLKGAPHPNAAKCLVSWMVSDEAQAMILKIDFKSNTDLPPGAPKTAKLVIADTAEQIALIADTQRVLQTIFAP
jgi:iron(III) transport system substrate-binding protein